jgi:PAS domain S-box-containing protein
MEEPPSLDSTRRIEADRERHFDLSLDLLCVAGLDGRFRRVNPAWTRVLGWSEAELLARPVADFMHPEDRERTLQARENLANGTPVRGLENRYLCRDGSFRWLEWQSAIEPSGSTVFAVARDITESRRVEHEALILGKLKSTGILAAGIAHDFNNLLTSLMLNLEMLALTGAITERQAEHLRQAQEAGHAARTLTQQFVILADGGNTARKLTEPNGLLVKSLELALAGSNCEGVHDIAADLWTAELDEGQITQAISNIVVNARESMPHGGKVQLRAENVLITERRGIELPVGEYVRVSISDTGPGMPPDVLPRIFDPYFSTKKRGSQKGMGLGLTICHAVIQKHGGAVVVDSAVGKGSTFHLYLPASTQAGANGPVPAAAPAARRTKILVMDDEDSMRLVMAQTLLQFGYEAELAKNGEEAVALYETAHQSGHPFDVVLLDLTVKGGMGGAETMTVLRERMPTVRAVLMSGYSHENTFRDYARHGFRAALAKPFRMETLRSVLSEVVAVSA